MTTINAKLDSHDLITIDGILHSIVERRNFDDFGVTLDSYKVVNFQGNTRVVHSNDEGQTFYEE